MMTTDIRTKVEEIRESIDRLDESQFDYAIGVNEVRLPPDASAGGSAPPGHDNDGPGLRDLWRFYAACDGFDMPDLHVGYFVDPLRRVRTATERGEPRRIEPGGLAVQVFGSDGGGGRFAIGTADGRVYYLPSSGAVHDGTFREDATVKIRPLAPSLLGFLERLHFDIEAFVEGRAGHVFMV